MNRFDTPPGFVDPDDDGINYYFDENGQRITKAEWLASEAEVWAASDAGAASELPFTEMAHLRLAEAGTDFEDYLANLAADYARQAGRNEVGWEDVCQAAQSVFDFLRGV